MDVLATITMTNHAGKYSMLTSPNLYSGYKAKMTSISPISYGLGDNNNYEYASTEIVMDDSLVAGSRHWRDVILQDADDKYLVGKKIVLKKADDSTVIKTLYITDFELGWNKIILSVSDRFSVMVNNILKIIDEKEYPNADTQFEGLPIPITGGDSLVLAGAFKAYYTGKTGYEYVACIEQGATASLIRANKPDGTNITGTSALATTGGIHYINYTDTVEEYLEVSMDGGADMNTAYEQFERLIEDILSDYEAGWTTFSCTGLDAFLTERNLNANPSYTFDENLTGAELFKKINDCFNIEFYLDKDMEPQFAWMDYENLTAVTSFIEDQIMDFSAISYDKENIKNEIQYRCLNYNYESKWLRGGVFRHSDSQTNWGKYFDEVELPFFERLREAHLSIKHRLILNKNPDIRFNGVTINLDSFWYSGTTPIEPGDIINVTHQIAETNTARTYQVRRITLDFMNNRATLDLKDYQYLNNLRTADKLLIHSDYEVIHGTFYDDSVGGNNIISDFGVVRHDPTDQKWQNSCIKFNGTTDYLSCPDNGDWDITSQTNCTIFDSWMKANDLANSQWIISQYEDATNFWRLRFDPGTNLLQFTFQSGGVNIIDLLTSANAINDTTTWHHILVVKVGDNYGIYVDGTQLAFVNDNSTDTLTGPLEIGRKGNGSGYYNGKMDEPRITHDNVFGAAPVVGLTDTITVPTAAYTDEG